MADPEQIAEQITNEAAVKAAAVVNDAANKIDEAQKTAEHIALAAMQSKHEERLESMRKEHEAWRASEAEHRQNLEARVANQETILGKMSSILEQLVTPPKVIAEKTIVAAEKAASEVNPESQEVTKVKKEVPARIRRFL